MKYFHTAVILISAIVLILFCPLTASAQSTNLDTSVPRQVTVHIEISGSGAVTVNGQTFTRSGSILVDRLEDVMVSVSANAGRILKSIHLNGSDVTEQVSGGTLIIVDIPFDAALAVVFTADAPWLPGSNPSTGDTAPVCFYLLCAGASLLILLLLMRSNSKKEYET